MPKPPMHLALSKKNITAYKEHQTVQMSLLSEGDWTATMEQGMSEWCIPTDLSGTATDGETEKVIGIELAQNDTGKPRQGKITFTLKSGGLTESHVLNVLQYATAK